jgi:hypothetical protein
MPRSSTYRYVGGTTLAALLLAAATGFFAPAAAQTFAPSVNISNSSGTSSGHRTAAVSPNVYVIWAESQGALGTVFSRSTDDGQSFSAPIQIFKAAASSETPQIAATGSNIYVARTARLKPKQPLQVYFKRSTNSGASFSNEVQVTTGNGSQLHAMATAGANVYLIWLQNDPADGGVFFARSTDGGATFSASVKLSSNDPRIGSVTLAAEGAGVHVAWSQGPGGSQEVFYRRSSDGGASFFSEINISNSAGASVFPQVAVGGPNVYLAWRETEFRFSASADGGASFSAPVDLSSGRADTRGVGGGPRLAASGNAVQVIWHSDQFGKYQVIHRGSTDGGASFTAERNISMNAQDSWGIVTASGTNVLIAWTDALPASDILLVHSGDSGVTFGGPVNVSISSGESGDQQLVIGGATRVHATWLDNTPGNSEVFYARGTLP